MESQRPDFKTMFYLVTKLHFSSLKKEYYFSHGTVPRIKHRNYIDQCLEHKCSVNVSISTSDPQPRLHSHLRDQIPSYSNH